jgi:hypothetical protein
MCPARPSLHWVPSVRVPQLQRYSGSLRFLDIHPAALRIPSFGGTTVRRLAMQTRSDASLPARICFSGPRAVPLCGDVEASQLLGDSLCACPARETPARPATPRQVRCAEIAFRRYNAVGPRGLSCSRGSVTRPTHSLSTLRSTGRPGATQDSLPAGCLALSGRVQSPRDSSRSFRYSSFPSSKLCLAQ